MSPASWGATRSALRTIVAPEFVDRDRHGDVGHRCPGEGGRRSRCDSEHVCLVQGGCPTRDTAERKPQVLADYLEVVVAVASCASAAK
eukprot:8684958-Lingulodinium_polyedra.AAC.1